ncbi:MAG: hypothetical protein U1E56_13785 [Bauldia sp.]
MAITTAMPTQFKVDLLKAFHCFLATQSGVSCAGSNGAFTLTSIASTANLAVGMAVTGTNVAAGAVIASIDSGTQVTLSKAHTGAVSSVTFTADPFKIALIKASPTGTYGAASVNYSDITGNSDEASGTGYSAGGLALTNVNPSNPSGAVAIATFGANPSWAGASISVAGCMIYNTARRGDSANRAVGVFDFGGTQTVTGGTLTLVLPTADAANALLRIT